MPTKSALTEALKIQYTVQQDYKICLFESKDVF